MVAEIGDTERSQGVVAEGREWADERAPWSRTSEAGQESRMHCGCSGSRRKTGKGLWPVDEREFEALRERPLIGGGRRCEPS